MTYDPSIEDSITYLEGNALEPQCSGNKIIAHIVNNQGGWGSGFVVPLGKLYPRSEIAYRRWSDHRDNTEDDFVTRTPSRFELGETQFVTVKANTMIANMCAQDGYGSAKNPHPCSLDATAQCLGSVIEKARDTKATIHMPRIGCGLGGATWDEILGCLWDARVVGRSLPMPYIFVYDLPGTKP